MKEEEEKEEREMRDVKNTVEGRGKPGKTGQGQSVMSAPVNTPPLVPCLRKSATSFVLAL